MTSELTLHLERVLPAAPALVFRMHAEPDLLATWWGPNGFAIPLVELDVRVGGAYRIEMQPPDGDAFALTGEFREVDPPARLAYTFVWEPPDPDDRETLATLTLEPVGTSTRVTVDHGVFATEARRSLHEQGWSETLDRLERALAATGHD